MQVTIIGLPASGKTTVFNALTGVQAETGFGGGRAAPNLAVVKVPDERLDRLAELYHPRKVTPADVTYADVAIPAGAAGEGTVAPDLLAQVRNAEALSTSCAPSTTPRAHPPGRPVARPGAPGSGVHAGRPGVARNVSRRLRATGITARRRNARPTFASWPSLSASCRPQRRQPIRGLDLEAPRRAG